MKVREPVPRPLDVLAAELLLSASQAFLAGVLLYLALGMWDDRGVGVGPVAVVVAGLGLAVGGAWLYWLLGGVGWPLAAVNVPGAIFLGFGLVLSWSADPMLHLEGIPLLLSLAASIYGLVCGVFLDSPRRLRWDQRQRPRATTSVPRVSAATRRAVAAVPRSIPRRASLPAEELEAMPAEAPSTRPTATGMGSHLDGLAADGPRASDDALLPTTPGAPADRESPVETTGVPTTYEPRAAQEPAEKQAPERPGGEPPSESRGLGALMPTERLGRAAGGEEAASPAGAGRTDRDSGAKRDEPAAIELPTSVEPRAQRSPWAWAAPPEWSRDEDDETAPPPPRGRT